MSEKPRIGSDELHELLSDLGRCVQEAVTASADVSSALDRIRERGYEPSFVVQTNIVSASAPASGREGEVGLSVGAYRGPDPVEAPMTPLDKKFLRSLKIGID